MRHLVGSNEKAKNRIAADSKCILRAADSVITDQFGLFYGSPILNRGRLPLTHATVNLDANGDPFGEVAA
jgi:hypothetical protein